MSFRPLLVGALMASSAFIATLAEAKDMNFAFVTPADGHYGQGAKAFAAKMEELSNGEITINL